jgi:hypothetical protein
MEPIINPMTLPAETKQQQARTMQMVSGNVVATLRGAGLALLIGCYRYAVPLGQAGWSNCEVHNAPESMTASARPVKEEILVTTSRTRMWLTLLGNEIK